AKRAWAVGSVGPCCHASKWASATTARPFHSASQPATKKSSMSALDLSMPGSLKRAWATTWAADSVVGAVADGVVSTGGGVSAGGGGEEGVGESDCGDVMRPLSPVTVDARVL